MPVTGRWRSSIDSKALIDALKEKDCTHRETILKDFSDRWLPEDNPKVQYARPVFERLLRISGLENLDWCLKIVDAPGKSNVDISNQLRPASTLTATR